jgi:hypothetical protein
MTRQWRTRLRLVRRATVIRIELLIARYSHGFLRRSGRSHTTSCLRESNLRYARCHIHPGHPFDARSETALPALPTHWLWRRSRQRRHRLRQNRFRPVPLWGTSGVAAITAHTSLPAP